MKQHHERKEQLGKVFGELSFTAEEWSHLIEESETRHAALYVLPDLTTLK